MTLFLSIVARREGRAYVSDSALRISSDLRVPRKKEFYFLMELHLKNLLLQTKSNKKQESSIFQRKL
jgi:hypothetical protein